jgi:hypothetical protein
MGTKKKERDTSFEMKMLEKHAPIVKRNIEEHEKPDDIDIDVIKDLVSRFGFDAGVLSKELRAIRAIVRMHTDIQGFYLPGQDSG